ncbi:hypothetical protein Trydic_g23350 [Trypoxylus dichotomus]
MFSGKVVLVTGASAGIGANTAIRFAKERATLVLTARNKANLEDTAQKCRQKNSLEPLVIPGDITIDDDVKNILNTTVGTYGKLDVLVNNAGWMGFTPLGAPDVIHQFDKIFNTNIRSAYLLSNLALPYLIKSKGNIVNISSVVSLRTFKNLSAYSMSKAALDHFTRSAALELAPKQVRVNSVNPGVIDTNLHINTGLPEANIKQLLDIAKNSNPVGRLGYVSDISKAILFLASEEASFITGECLVVDGGLCVSSPMPL